MKFIKLECPNCGGKLKLNETTEEATCTHCGYDFAVEKQQPEVHNHYYGPSSKTSSTTTNSSSTYSSTTYPSTTKTKKPAKFPPLVIIFIILIPLLPQIFNSNSTSGSSVTSRAPRTIPVSSPVVQFSEYLFHRPIEAITQDDLKTVKYLDLSYDDDYQENCWIFRYSLSDYATTPNFDDTIIEVTIPSKEEVDQEDLQVFSGVTYLSTPSSRMTSYSSKTVSFAHMSELTTYLSANRENISTLVECLPDVKQIVNLRGGIRSEKDLTALLTFTNLKEFEISSFPEGTLPFSQLSALTSLERIHITSDTNDIAWLASITNLKELTIDYFNIEDFQVLYGLPKLEKLVIDSVHLKNIAFVKSMPLLKSFTLESSKILDIEPLRGMTSLQHLSLTRNHDLTDLSALETLTSLTNLEIHATYNAKVPPIPKLTQLKSANIDSRHLPSLSTLSQLEHLTLDVSGEFDFEALFPYTSLSFLRLEGSEYKSALPLNNMPTIRTLELHDMRPDTYTECFTIFQLHYVENLHISDSWLYSNSEIIPQNTALKELSLDKETHLAVIKDTHSETSFDKLPELYESMPNLEHLTIDAGKVTSLEFVAFMPNLKEIDFPNNYITDIAPLTTLKNLEQVNLNHNTVNNIELLDSSISLLYY